VLAKGPKDEPDGPTYQAAVKKFAEIMHLSEADKAEDGNLVCLTHRVVSGSRLAVDPHAARGQHGLEGATVAAAGGGEDLADRRSRHGVASGAGRLAGAGEQPQHGHAPPHPRSGQASPVAGPWAGDADAPVPAASLSIGSAMALPGRTVTPGG
jgi:hypothetical protein